MLSELGELTMDLADLEYISSAGLRVLLSAQKTLGDEGAVMNEQRRQQLLSASSSGKNEAERGFMGKLRAFFEPAATLPFFYFASGDGEFAEAVWTLSVYQRELQQELDRNAPGAAESWDELEKSVVAHLADDVKVSIRGSDVEMTIIKKLA